MGNCFSVSKKSTSEIRPYDCIKPSSPTVKLYGSPSSTLTAYVRFALLYKSVSPRFLPSETQPDTVLQIGSETVSGPPREALLRFIESKFPHPPLRLNDDSIDCEEDQTTPCIVRVTWLQHKSVMWHVERMVRWAEDLAKRGGRTAVDPLVGSPRMEVRKFGNSYSQLLELMLEHAQMEERIVFPLLEKADPGTCKVANKEHARDLPLMNGIKEDIKSVGVLDSGNPCYQEALSNLSTRFKSLQKHCKEHFELEERDLLPLIEAMELSREQEKRILVQCLGVMQGTHSHLFNFFLEGLLPQEAMQYLDLIMECSDKEGTMSMSHMGVG
ncbi:hypothetical protein ACOSP7_033051 [Xanthoceras sorbifolium]|uniref:Hemerythrin-like domain-containing protein n=1 Tax=Xanthoceras sorbifolium TaxID=99658 RepID=A0ABQ8H355_9ROSI|nr:hypothetical protein JRO89_XS14G0008300 [Xanthoceras sorbifolium]